MKQFIKKMLQKTGWELRRVDGFGTSTMTTGLQLLLRHEFDIKTVLDVGASDGRWSRECLKFFPDLYYVLFEPQPVHSAALDRFSKSNNRVRVVKKAVGGSDGYTYFSALDPLGGALACAESEPGTIDVEMTTINTSVSQLQIEPPYLLKLDTHGYEKSILEGASRVIEETEVLIVEAYNHKITDESFLFWELCAYLAGKGFRPIDLVDVLHRPYDKSLWQMDLIFIKSKWDNFAYISYK